MYEKKIVITGKIGLHARPASDFVKTAKKFTSQITVTCGESEADAKSIIAVLALGAGEGKEITISATGPDEKEAVSALTAVIKHAE